MSGRLQWGGENARRARRSPLSLLLLSLLAGALACVAVAAPAARADTGDPLAYWGGPVMHSVSGIVVDWGHVDPIYSDEAAGDPGFIKSLAAASGTTSNISGILAQYLDSTGANSANRVSYGGQFQITPSYTGTTISDDQIQQELVGQIAAGQLPTPSGDGLSTIYLVNFPAADQICLPDGSGGQYCSGDYFCAYHGSATLPSGKHVLYAVLPDNTSGGMSFGCGQAPTALQNQTSFLSHEWAEAITDPLVAEASADAPPLAWYDDACVNQSTCVSGEVGDKCNQQQGTNDGWTVQLEWSNRDGVCEASEPAYSQPTAAFSAPASASVGGSVSFNAAGSSDPGQNTASATWSGQAYSIASGLTSYAWNWGDGSGSGSGVAASHTYSAPGSYQVSLTVTDGLGFTSTVTRQVSVATAAAPPSPGSSTPSPAPAPSTNPAPAPTPGPSTSPPVTSTSPAPVLSPPVTSTSPAPVLSPPVTSTPQAPATPTPLPAPSVTTGSARGVGGVRATLGGTVNPQGSATTYHFEYGTSRAYGRSSTRVLVGSAAAARGVSVTVSGLRPHTRYHFRLVASSRAGTTVGPDVTFQTSGARTASVRLGGHVVKHGPRRIVVRFSCSGACTAHFTVVPVLHGIGQIAALPKALGRANVRLRARGSATAVVKYSIPRGGQAAISTVRLVGYATGPGGARSAPLVHELRVR